MNKTNIKKDNKVIAVLHIDSKRNWKILPNRTMEKIHNKTVLQYIIETLKSIKLINSVVISIFNDNIQFEKNIKKFCSENKVILKSYSRNGITEKNIVDNRSFQGKYYSRESFEDGYGYIYYDIAQKKNADIIIKLNANAPLINKKIIEDMLNEHIENNLEYLQIFRAEKYVKGIEIEIFNLKALKIISKISATSNVRGNASFLLGKHPPVVQLYRDVYLLEKPELEHRYIRFLAESNRTIDLLKNVFTQLNKENKEVNIYNAIDIALKNPKWIFPYPECLEIEISSECQLNCNFCPHTYLDRENKYMDFASFKSIIDQIKYYTDVCLKISGFGEPLMNPDILNIIEYACQNFKVVFLYTNGILLNKEISNQLIKSRLKHLIVNCQSIDNDSYKNVYSTNYYETIKTNIEYLIKARNKNKHTFPFVRLPLINQKNDNIPFQDFSENWNDIVDYTYLSRYVLFDGLVPNNQKHDTAPSDRFPCQHLLYDLYIDVDGNVHTCNQVINSECRMQNAELNHTEFRGSVSDPDNNKTNTSFNIGNIKEKSLKELWFDKKHWDLLVSQLNKKYTGSCKNCKEWFYR